MADSLVIPNEEALLPHRSEPTPVSHLREPLIDGNKSLGQITDDICRPFEGKPTYLWYAGLGISLDALRG